MRICTFLLACSFSWSAYGASIVVIQGGKSEFDRRYFSGFSSLSTENVSAFFYEEKQEKALLAKIKGLSPDLVLSIGDAPLPQLAALLPSTPILAHEPFVQSVASKANVVVMQRENSLARVLALGQMLFPNRKTIGTVFNPEHSQAGFDILAADAAKVGIKVAALKVVTAKDIQAFIGQFTGKVDLIYWMADPVTSTELALLEIYSFAEQTSLPVFSLDPEHVHRGAFMTVHTDPFKMGEHAWKTAEAILREKKIPQMPIQTDSGQYTVTLSMKAIGKFGLGAEKLFTFLQVASHEGYSVQVRQ